MVKALKHSKFIVGITSVFCRYCVGAVFSVGSLLTGAAQAEQVQAEQVQAEQVPPWEGYWSGNANWCARAGDVGDETPTWFGRDGFFGIEWSCEITSLRDIGVGQSWAIDTTCLDAGFQYDQSQIFLLTYEDRLLIIDETGVTDNLVRCAVPNKEAK